MKYIFVLSLIFLLSCSEKKGVENDLSKNDLIGNVYECNEAFFDIVRYGDGSIGEKLNFSAVSTFDRDGNLIQLIQYDSANKQTTKYVYKIDGNWNTVEKRFFRPDGSPGFKIFYKYDERNNKIEELLYDSSNILEEKYIHKYDNNNQLISSDVTKRDTNRNESYTWIYDSKGNIIRENYYYGIDLEDNVGLNLDKYIIHKYNDQDKAVEILTIEPKTYYRDETYLRTTYEYKNDGKIIEEISYLKDGSSDGKNISIYNNDKKEIDRKVYDVNGRLIKHLTFKYDENGKKIEESVNKPTENKSYTFKFEYKDIDHKGNWLTYLEYYNNEPYKKTVRKITYF